MKPVQTLSCLHSSAQDTALKEHTIVALWLNILIPFVGLAHTRFHSQVDTAIHGYLPPFSLAFSRFVCFTTAPYTFWKFEDVLGRQG
jgi:hypothetical protein